MCLQMQSTLNNIIDKDQPIIFNKCIIDTDPSITYNYSTSANSINIGRLVPQIAYYVYAYAKLYKKGEIAKDEKMSLRILLTASMCMLWRL